MSHLLWERFLAVCQSHTLAYERGTAVSGGGDGGSGGEPAAGQGEPGTRDGAPAASLPGSFPPRNAIFRHHAQLLANAYYQQDTQARRTLLAAHFEIIRKLGAIVVAGELPAEGGSSTLRRVPPPPSLQLLLAQCMVLAEFMLRTVHDSERSLSLAARLSSDLARLPELPAVAGGLDASGGVSSKSAEQRSRYLSVFEADEEAGVMAWHERPGAARASSRALCLEVSPTGYAGWREAWLGVLTAAAASTSEDAEYLFFCAWRLLGTLPPEQLSHGGEGARGGGDGPSARSAARLEPGVAGMANLRSCLLGLQTNVAEWGLQSPSFSAALSTMREGAPGWFGVEARALAEAMGGGATRTTAQSDTLARQLHVHGLVEAFAVYARAALASAAEQGSGLAGGPGDRAAAEGRGSSSDDRSQSSSEGGGRAGRGNGKIVELSLGLVRLAEECLRYYHRTIEGALTVLHVVGEREQLGESPFRGARGSIDETDASGPARGRAGVGAGSVRAEEADAAAAASTAALPHIPAELAVPIALLVQCHTSSTSLSRLTSLGCDLYLVGGLHSELNYPGEETLLEKLSPWHRKACTRSTSRRSQCASKASAPFAESDELWPETGTRGRDGGSGTRRGRDSRLPQKWEVMVTGAAWLTVASTQALDLAGTKGSRDAHAPEAARTSSGAKVESENTTVSDGDAVLAAQNVDGVVDCASRLCVSARSMLNSVLLSLLALTDALSSAGTPAASTRRTKAMVGERSAGSAEEEAAAAGEAWSAIAFRAVALWGELSTQPWCKWFAPLCGRSLEKLLCAPDRKWVTGSGTHAELKRERTRGALELWKSVTGAWHARRADTLVRLALDGEAGGQNAMDDGALVEETRVCAKAALEEGLERLLGLLAMPHTAGDVVSFYGGDLVGAEASASSAAAKVAHAIAAAAPRCPPTTAARVASSATEEPASIEVEAATPAPQGGGLLVSRGEVSTLTSLLERPGFSGYLPKVLLVLRTALEAEASAYSTPSPSAAQKGRRRPLAAAVAAALSGRPEGTLEALVTGAVAPQQPDEVGGKARGTEDAMAVLSLVVGYPGAGGVAAGEEQEAVVRDQNVLRKRLMQALLSTVGSWVGRRIDHDPRRNSSPPGRRGEDNGRKGEGAVDLASLSLWLASKDGMLAELAVSVMGVARGLVRRLERPGSATDEMEMDTVAAEQEAEEEEAARSLARCLELLATVLRPPVGSSVEESDTDSEDADSLPNVGNFFAGTDEGDRGLSVAATGETALAVAGADSRQEPPLVCTFVSSQRQFVKQHWYHCYTCNLVVDKGCCRLCVRVCHRGHDVCYARLSCFFCDCGSGTAESAAADGDTPPPSLENSPASSAGVDPLTGSPPAPSGAGAAWTGAGGASGAQEGGRTKCNCLKARTKRELDSILHPSPAATKGDAGDVDSAAGRARGWSRDGRMTSSRKQGGSKNSGRGRLSRAAVSRTKAAARAAAAAAAAAVEWRDSPSPMASMHAALFGDGGSSSGIMEDLHAAHSVLLARFNAMRETAGVVGRDATGDGEGRSHRTLGRSRGGGGAAGAALARPWDALCEAPDAGGISATFPPALQPAAFLRCRALLDPNGRVPAYPLLAPARLVRNGSLDVRLPSEGARARQDRTAMALHGVVRRNLAASSCGKMAVAEGQKVLIVDPVGVLALRYATAAGGGGSGGGGGGGGAAASGAKASTAGASAPGSRMASPPLTSPADSPVDRSHLCVVSTMVVGFDVTGMAFNPANERHLVVWGLRQCCVIVLNSRGVALRRVQVGGSQGSRCGRVVYRPFFLFFPHFFFVRVICIYLHTYIPALCLVPFSLAVFDRCL